MSYDIYIGIKKDYAHCFNYTFNCAPMFDLAFNTENSLKILEGLTGAQAESLLHKAILYFCHNKKQLEKLNPTNGWGNYEGAKELLIKIWQACMEYPDDIIEMSY